MTNAEMLQVQEWVANGGELLIGSTHSGDRKIKVKHGPFHVFTSRFSASEEEVRSLKSLLAEIRDNRDAA